MEKYEMAFSGDSIHPKPVHDIGLTPQYKILMLDGKKIFIFMDSQRTFQKGLHLSGILDQIVLIIL